MAQCEAQSMRRARETVGRAVLRPRSRRRHRHRREPARRPASQPLCRSMAVCKKEQGPLPPRANRLTAMTSLDAGTLVCASNSCSACQPVVGSLPCGLPSPGVPGSWPVSFRGAQAILAAGGTWSPPVPSALSRRRSRQPVGDGHCRMRFLQHLCIVHPPGVRHDQRLGRRMPDVGGSMR